MAHEPGLDGSYLRIGVPELYASLQRVAEGNQRLESKVDSALSIQTLRLEYYGNELARLRDELQEAQAKIEDVDRKPVVTTKALITATTIMGVIIGIIVSIVGLFLR